MAHIAHDILHCQLPVTVVTLQSEEASRFVVTFHRFEDVYIRWGLYACFRVFIIELGSHVDGHAVVLHMVTDKVDDDVLDNLLCAVYGSLVCKAFVFHCLVVIPCGEQSAVYKVAYRLVGGHIDGVVVVVEQCEILRALGRQSCVIFIIEFCAQ